MLIVDHKEAMHHVALAMRMLSLINLPEVMERADRAITTGPFLDPTLYRDKGEALLADVTMLNAAKPLWLIAKSLTQPQQDVSHA